MFAKLFERDGQQVLVRRGEHEGRPAILITLRVSMSILATVRLSVKDSSLIDQVFDKVKEAGAFEVADSVRQEYRKNIPASHVVLPPNSQPFARLFDENGGQIAAWLGDDEEYGEVAIWIAWEDGESIITTHASYRTEHHRKQDWQDITSAEAARAYARKIGF